MEEMKHKPTRGFRNRYQVVRNAMYRHLKERGGWLTSAELIKAFEDGSMKNSRGKRYLMQAPTRPADLSQILRRDSRFVSKYQRIAHVGDSGPYEVKFWSVGDE